MFALPSLSPKLAVLLQLNLEGKIGTSLDNQQISAIRAPIYL